MSKIEIVSCDDVYHREVSLTCNSVVVRCRLSLCGKSLAPLRNNVISIQLFYQTLFSPFSPLIYLNVTIHSITTEVLPNQLVC